MTAAPVVPGGAVDEPPRSELDRRHGRRRGFRCRASYEGGKASEEFAELLRGVLER